MPAAGIFVAHWSWHCGPVRLESAIWGSVPFVQLFAVATVVHVSGVTFFVNVAVTAFAADIVTAHAPVPVHAPVHPANVEPAVATCVSVTLVLKPKFAEHVAPQLMPVGVDVTVPVPVPFFVTVSASGISVKFAVTAFAAVIGTTHAPAPVHAPAQLVNVEPVVAS